MNSAVIVGRAGQDPEIKYFESGKVKTSFSLAVNRWDAKTKAEVTESATTMTAITESAVTKQAITK